MAVAAGAEGKMAEAARPLHDSTQTQAAESAADVPACNPAGLPLTESFLARVGIFRHGGTLPSAICLSKATLGAGVLTMAAHCAEVGLSYQVAGLAGGALLSLLSWWMIAETCVATSRWSFEDVCEELTGPVMSFVTGASIYFLCLGAGVGYLIATSQVFKVLFDATDQAQQLFIIAVGVVICVPLSVLRYLGFMRHLAALGIFSLMLLVVAVIYHLASNGRDDSVTEETLWFGKGSTDLYTHMNALNNVIFAFCNQVNAPQVIRELHPAPTVRKTLNVALVTVALCVLFYASVSLFGVLAFGVGEGQKDSLILDLQAQRQNPVVVAALVASMFSTLICLQLNVYPMRQFAAYLVRKARGKSVEDTLTDATWGRRTITRWLDIVAAITSVLVMIVIAVAVRKLVTVLDFLGAFGGAYASYVVPAVWLIQLSRREPDFSWLAPRVLAALALMALGLFFVVFGTYSAVKGALSS